jgi:hypothetical protein
MHIRVDNAGAAAVEAGATLEITAKTFDSAEAHIVLVASILFPAALRGNVSPAPKAGSMNLSPVRTCVASNRRPDGDRPASRG